MLRCSLLGLMLLLLCLPAPAMSGDARLSPTEVVNGGVVLLRWQGQASSTGVVRFNDRVFYLYPDHSGAIALLPVPLDTPAGRYPLIGAMVDRHGTTTSFALDLLVNHEERPLERLTLPEHMVSPHDPAVLQRIAAERVRLEEIFAQRQLRIWDRFVRPVEDPISSVFGKRRLMNGKPRAPHSGTDFRSPRGTVVHAMTTGRVVLADDLFYTGKTVVLDHGEGLYSLYAHLSISQVGVGDLVAAGHPVGKVGSTGRSTGPHLHLSVRLLGERIDPLLLLKTVSKGQD